MTRFHLVRHGEVENPEHVMYGLLPGWNLSEGGMAQAREAARYLAEADLAAIYTSPLERAVATAEAIVAVTDASLEVRQDLTEWQLGEVWGGLRWQDIRRDRPEQWDEYMNRPAEMTFVDETLSDLASRMAGAMLEIARSHEGRSVAVVSHSDPLKAARLRLTGRELSGLHAVEHPTGGIVTLDLPGGAVTATEIDHWPTGAR